MTDKKADLAGPGIGSYDDVEKILPTGYEPLLSPKERMKAVYAVRKYIEENLIPEITPDDVDSYLNIIFQAIEFMSGDSQSLMQYIKRKDQFDVNMWDDLVQS